MTQTRRAHALRPWLTWLRDCAAQPTSPQPAGEGAEGALARAGRVLVALAQDTSAPIPASIVASEHVLDGDGNVRDLRPARALREMWCDRDAVLRLGVWGALRELEPTPQQPGDFHTLMAQVSRLADARAPTVLPSRARGAGSGGFADSEEVAVFFNGRLRRTLVNLAALYDGHGADFARWQTLPDYVPGSSTLEPWSQAWSVAVVATYVDWLHRASGGSMPMALRLLWDHQPKRFRPAARVLRPAAGAAPGAPKPAVLPTGDDGMHFDLQLPFVLAQVLDHRPERGVAFCAGEQRHVVALCMKTLDQADSQRRDLALAGVRNYTRYRGLTIVQIYMAVAVAHLGPWLSPVGRAA